MNWDKLLMKYEKLSVVNIKGCKQACWHNKCKTYKTTLHNLKETALYFPSIKAICSFLKEMNRRKFVLFGKRSILLAPFSSEEVAVAEKHFGAKTTEAPETGRVNKNKTRPYYMAQ